MEKPKVFLGEWIVTYEDGIYRPDSDDKVTFKTKKEAVNFLFYSCCDPREVPKVVRIRRGNYEYTPIDMDTQKFSESSYRIVLITKDNISELEDEWDTQWRYENSLEENEY